MTAYLSREIRHTVRRAMNVMPVVVITGMRQTGKTTFLQNDSLFDGFRYVTLDDYAYLQTALHQPEELLASADRICIDEAQKAPSLMTAVKRTVDRNRRPGRIVLSGSANFSLLKEISESLAGRSLHVSLQPFSLRERTGSIRQLPFLAKLLNGETPSHIPAGRPIASAEILKGGMPPVNYLSSASATLWFRGFEQTYLERDIRELARVDDVLGFRSIIRFSALRNGQIANLSQLARDARLSLATTTRYLRLAETSFLFRLLPPFLRNRTSRLIKSPKLYGADSGLTAFLAGVETLDHDEPLRGPLFETFVLQNLTAIVEAHAPETRFAFWHIQGRHEVDFILEHGRRCLAVEVKASGRWSESDLTSLRVFLHRVPSCEAAILAYNGTQSARLAEKLWAIPISTLIT